CTPMNFHSLLAPKLHWSAPRLPLVSCFCHRVRGTSARGLATRRSRALRRQSDTPQHFCESTHLPSAALWCLPTTTFVVSQPTPMKPATPNQALQRTHLRVTAPASTAAFPPTTQVPRRSGVSLSLRSLGDIHAHRLSRR